MPLNIATVFGATGVVMLFVVVEALSKASADPATELSSAMFASSPLDAFAIVKVAERNPAAEGTLATATTQSTVLSALSVQTGEPTLKSVVALRTDEDAADVAAKRCASKSCTCAVSNDCGANPCAITLRMSSCEALLLPSSR